MQFAVPDKNKSCLLLLYILKNVNVYFAAASQKPSFWKYCVP